MKPLYLSGLTNVIEILQIDIFGMLLGAKQQMSWIEKRKRGIYRIALWQNSKCLRSKVQPFDPRHQKRKCLGQELAEKDTSRIGKGLGAKWKKSKCRRANVGRANGEKLLSLHLSKMSVCKISMALVRPDKYRGFSLQQKTLDLDSGA